MAQRLPVAVRHLARAQALTLHHRHTAVSSHAPDTKRRGAARHHAGMYPVAATRSLAPLQIHVAAEGPPGRPDPRPAPVEDPAVRAGTPVRPGGAARAAAQKLVAELCTAGAGKLAAAPLATAIAAASPTAAFGISVPLLLLAGVPASFYAGRQVREGTGGGWPVQALFTVAALLPLLHALTCETQQERQQSLADSAAVLLSCALRDLLNAVIRRSYGRAVAVDDTGVPLDPLEAIRVRSGVAALGPFCLNTGIALAGSAFLEPALVELHGELGRPVSDAIIRAGWTVPLEAWRHASSEVGYIPGEGRSAMLDNLQDWRGTLGHGAMHSSMRYALNHFAVVPRIIGKLAPETGEAMEWLEAGIRGATEFRGFAVEKYDASRMSLA